MSTWLAPQGVPRLSNISGCDCEGVSGRDKHLTWWTRGRLSSSMWVGITQSLEGPDRTKCGGKRNLSPFSLPYCLRRDISFCITIYIISSPGSQVFGLNYTMAFLGLQFADGGSWILSLHDCASQFLIINLLFLSVDWSIGRYRHPTGFMLWKTLTYTCGSLFTHIMYLRGQK